MLETDHGPLATGFVVEPGLEPSRSGVPSGVWLKCPECHALLFRAALDRNHGVCHECSHLFPLACSERLKLLLDPGSFEECFDDLRPLDPLRFSDVVPYTERLKREVARTGLDEAAVVGRGRIMGIPLVIGVTDGRFLVGTMGSVVGEKLTRAFELATRQRCPVVVVCGSGGGVRLQEGTYSLMQMAKVSAAIARHRAAGLSYLSVLTDATLGGAAASFASLGDVILAEPAARVGYFSPKILDQYVRTPRPDRFQSSEANLEHGFVDRIVDRHDLRDILADLLEVLAA